MCCRDAGGIFQGAPEACACLFRRDGFRISFLGGGAGRRPGPGLLCQDRIPARIRAAGCQAPCGTAAAGAADSYGRHPIGSGHRFQSCRPVLFLQDPPPFRDPGSGGSRRLDARDGRHQRLRRGGGSSGHARAAGAGDCEPAAALRSYEGGDSETVPGSRAVYRRQALLRLPCDEAADRRCDCAGNAPPHRDGGGSAGGGRLHGFPGKGPAGRRAAAVPGIPAAEGAGGAGKAPGASFGSVCGGAGGSCAEPEEEPARRK